MNDETPSDIRIDDTGLADDRHGYDSIDLVNEVRRVFNANNWAIDEGDLSQGEGPFERTVRTVTKLHKEEAWLVLTLLEKFVRIEFEQYMIKMKRLVTSVINDVRPKRVAIVPIRSIKDTNAGKAKSGDLMTVVTRSAFSGTHVKADSYTDLGAKAIRDYIGQPGFFVLGVDDFVGTGETAISFINHFRKIFPGQLSTLKLASIVCLEQSLKPIQDNGIDIYCLHLMGKGISGNPDWSAADKTRFIKLMGEIERRIDVGHDYRLGFRKSEALVKMMRTPNNTFPVFWSTKTYEATPWPAIFPR